MKQVSHRLIQRVGLGLLGLILGMITALLLGQL